MKLSRKIIIPFLLAIILICIVVIVCKINCCWNRPVTKLISSDSISRRLVTYNAAKQNMANFDSISKIIFKNLDTNKIKVPFNGDIINSTDVLLALGLNNADLHNYVQCSKIRLETKLGFINDTIKIYVRPIDISSKPWRNLYFKKDGNLCYLNGELWVNPCKECIFCNIFPTSKVTPNSQKHALTDTDDIYYLDLNNPCPPCTIQQQ
jgi:hypothetical protein